METRETRKPRMFPRRWPQRLVALALLLGGIGLAQAEPFGLAYRDADGGWVDGLALDTTVAMRVEGLLAEVRVQQRYENNSDQWREGRYLLPLPSEAAVGGLSIRIGERLIEGEVQEKRQALASFQQAAAQGQRAALVEQHKPNLFRTAVSNIGPGEAIVIEITYWQQVDFLDGSFSLSLPLTFTPPPSGGFDLQPTTAGLDGVEPGTRAVTSMGAAALPPTMALSAEIQPGMPLAELVSPTHAIDVTQRAGSYHVSLRDWVVASDQDFELRWRPQPSAVPRQAVFAETVDEVTYALVMLVPPSLSSKPLPRELILVLDHSGSMLGASMDQAKAAVAASLDSLREGDNFNIVSFNHQSTRWFEHSVAATAADVHSTQQRIAQLQADGGTELGPALDLALAGEVERGRVRQVVLITDAAIGNEQDLLARIEKQRGEARVFAVGIGSAPNEYFIRRAAEHGRGSFELIRDIQQVDDRMGALMARIDRPMLSDIDLRWPTDADFYPSRIPDLYAGEPLMVVARLDSLEGRVQARGILSQQGWQSSLPLKVTARQQPVGIGKLWARARIAELEASLFEGADRTITESLILATALQHGITSRFTSLVAVERQPSRPQDAALQASQIPNADPAQTLNLAQGATSSRLHLGSALALLLIAGALLRRGSVLD